MTIATPGVVGAGQMGNGIAHVAARSGLTVVMRDLTDAFVQKGVDTIAKNLQRGVDEGKMTGPRSSTSSSSCSRPWTVSSSPARFSRRTRRPFRSRRSPRRPSVRTRSSACTS